MSPDKESCNYCLIAPYDLRLCCNHRICRKCIQLFGVPRQSSIIELVFCLFCRQNLVKGTRYKVHNPCRSLRVLSLDGGGCRGIVHLSFLKILARTIGIPIPVQENFDVVVGTSIGTSLSR